MVPVVSLQRRSNWMYRTFLKWSFALSLALLSSLAVAGTRMPPGSFLRQPAPNTATLNRALHTDAYVATRYARVFRQSPQALRKAFAALVLTRLSQDRILRVYYVHTGEIIGYRVRRVRRGTRVYALRDGTPVLAQICGNPLRTQLSVPEMLLPPEQTAAHIPVFDAEEPLPLLQTSAIAQALGPMRIATPPLSLMLAEDPEQETPVTPNSNGGGGGGGPVRIAALPLSGLPFLAGIPMALSGLILLPPTNRGANTRGDFIVAHDVIPPNRSLPPPHGPLPGSAPSPTNPNAPTHGTYPPSISTPGNPIRDWVLHPDTPPATLLPGETPERDPLPMPSAPIDNPVGGYPIGGIIGDPSGSSAPENNTPGGDTPITPIVITTPSPDSTPNNNPAFVPEPSSITLVLAAVTCGSLLSRRRKPKTLPARLSHDIGGMRTKTCSQKRG